MSNSVSGAMFICWGVGDIHECSWLFMIVITLVVRLCTIVLTHLLIACSYYKKVFFVFWCSKLVERNHELKLNEVEIPHDVAVVIDV